MRRKSQPEMAVKCDYCGNTTDTFVVNAEHLIFCRHQTPGQPAIKDCMEDYLKDKRKEKLVLKNKLQSKEVKVLTNRNTAIKKLDELKQYLIRKKENHPS